MSRKICNIKGQNVRRIQSNLKAEPIHEAPNYEL